MIPELWGLANLYSLAFPIGVLYAIFSYEYCRNDWWGIQAKGKRYLFMSVILYFVFFIIFVEMFSQPGCIIAGMEIPYFVYVFLTNFCYFIMVLGLVYWISHVDILLFNIVELVGISSVGIYMLQKPLMLIFLQELSNSFVMDLLIIVLGTIVILVFDYIYRKYIIVWCNKMFEGRSVTIKTNKSCSWQ